MNLNQRTVTIQLTRKELIDIMLLCLHHNAPIWQKLHAKLSEQLEKADAKFSREE